MLPTSLVNSLLPETDKHDIADATMEFGLLPFLVPFSPLPIRRDLERGGTDEVNHCFDPGIISRERRPRGSCAMRRTIGGVWQTGGLF